VRAVTAWNRWAWGLSGLATAAVLAVPGARLLTHPGAVGQHMTPADTVTRTVSLSQPITSLNVQSQGGPVRVQAGAGRGVHVTEVISYDKSAGPLPRVQDSVSGGRLTLANPAWCTSDCAVSFVVTVPSAVFTGVSSEGGSVSVSGAAGADVDSGGGPVSLTHISGPLTVSTDGGALAVNGLTGPLQADSGGGPAELTSVDAQTATINTGGGAGRVVFAAAPERVTLSTDGGPADLIVPGGPYALSADSDGAPESVGISPDPSASRGLTVNSGGGPLVVQSAPRP
jgi:hypothetical protein